MNINDIIQFAYTICSFISYAVITSRTHTVRFPPSLQEDVRSPSLRVLWAGNVWMYLSGRME